MAAQLHRHVYERNDDKLKLSSNVQCQKMLSKMGDNFPEQEKVVMSVMLVKINKRGKEHNRILLLTDKALYNLKHNHKCQRRIDLKKVVSVTISDTSQEFAIHIPEEYDYRYKSGYKERIASVLAELYKRKEGKKLAINKIQQDSMLQVTVTKDVAAVAREQRRRQLFDHRHRIKAREWPEQRLRRYQELSHHSTDEIEPNEEKEDAVWMDAEQMERMEWMEVERVERKDAERRKRMDAMYLAEVKGDHDLNVSSGNWDIDEAEQSKRWATVMLPPHRDGAARK